MQIAAIGMQIHANCMLNIGKRKKIKTFLNGGGEMYFVYFFPSVNNFLTRNFAPIFNW